MEPNACVWVTAENAIQDRHVKMDVEVQAAEALHERDGAGLPVFNTIALGARPIACAGEHEHVFREAGRPLYVDQMAQHLRADLKAAGIARPEIFERTAVRHPLRVHDLRATFVTVSLANGKTETWVADRTGHHD